IPKIDINGIMTEANYLIPIINIEMNRSQLKNKNLIINSNPQLEEIDQYIESGDIIIDDRIKNINYWEYINEGYELFKYEFSNFINKSQNEKIKLKILEIIDNKQLDNHHKIILIKLILYKII